MFGERGKSIISGGNDKTVKVWDCSRYLDAGQPSSSNDVLHLNINLSKKVSPIAFPGQCPACPFFFSSVAFQVSYLELLTLAGQLALHNSS